MVETWHNLKILELSVFACFRRVFTLRCIELMEKEAAKGRTELRITEDMWNSPERPRIPVDPNLVLGENEDPEVEA